MDSVVSAWDNILYSMFPNHAAHRGGDFYSIELRRHAGAWHDGWGRSIAVQLLTPNWEVKPGSGLRPSPGKTTDVAWVELAAPNKTRSRSAWRELMQVAVDALAEKNPGRRSLMTLVAGFKWLPFMWDPVKPLHPKLGPLMMRGDGEDESWPVDPRIYTVPREREAERTFGLTADSLDAYTLDYWTEDGTGTVQNLKNLL